MIKTLLGKQEKDERKSGTQISVVLDNSGIRSLHLFESLMTLFLIYLLLTKSPSVYKKTQHYAVSSCTTRAPIVYPAIQYRKNLNNWTVLCRWASSLSK